MNSGIEYIKDALEGSIERLTKAIRSISTDHAYIHDGRLFSYPVKLAMLAGASYKITMLTPSVASGLENHYRPARISTGGDNVTVTLYRDPTGNSGGSAITPINRNQSSTRTSQSTITIGQTVTGNGTLVDMQYVGGGTGVGGNTTGEVSSAEDEIVLEQNKLYTIVIDNGSADNQTLLVLLHWYEEDEA